LYSKLSNSGYNIAEFEQIVDICNTLFSIKVAYKQTTVLCDPRLTIDKCDYSFKLVNEEHQVSFLCFLFYFTIISISQTSLLPASKKCQKQIYYQQVIIYISR